MFCGQGDDLTSDGQKTTQIETNQTRFQLMLTTEQYKQWKALLSGKVFVEGKLMMAHTGHHHTALLIQVTEIKSAQ